MAFDPKKYAIKKDYLPSGTKRRRGIALDRVRFIVLHDTGNDNSTAAQNVKYYKNSANVESASAHVFIDAKEIIECIPTFVKPEKAWHVLYNRTKDNELFGDDANDCAIGVELCYSTDGKFDTKEAYKKYVWFIALLCKTYSLNPRKHLIGHEHLDPGRKTDPTNSLKTIGKTFADVINDIEKELAAVTPVKVVAAKPTGKKLVVVDYAGKEGLNIRQKADFDSKVVAVAHKGEAFTILEELPNHYRIAAGYITKNKTYVHTVQK